MTQYKEGEMATAMGQHFPNVDITHKPKRLQGENIRLAQANEAVTVTIDGTTSAIEDVPSVLTLERAIKFYRDHSDTGATAKLYQATAKWLNDLLTIKSNPTPKSEVTIATVNVEDVIAELKKRQETAQQDLEVKE